eukprot:GHVS01084977.1.p1 GENE.GHVS01084977.1~~GHVS01084977.1.p1  ORF type:complete len:420 (+),score=78.57 GHVS01084977.1:61-1320(+)
MKKLWRKREEGGKTEETSEKEAQTICSLSGGGTYPNVPLSVRSLADTHGGGGDWNYHISGRRGAVQEGVIAGGISKLLEEEVEALKAIYSDESVVVFEPNVMAPKTLLRLTVRTTIEGCKQTAQLETALGLSAALGIGLVEIRFSIPLSSYPSSLPSCQVHTELLGLDEEVEERIAQESVGKVASSRAEAAVSGEPEGALFDIIEAIRSAVEARVPPAGSITRVREGDGGGERVEGQNGETRTDEEEASNDELAAWNAPENENATAVERVVSSGIKMYHGDVIIDRKSVFQGHVAVVHSRTEVAEVAGILRSLPKVCRATHNMTAYRLMTSDTRVTMQDNESDGESGAGHKLQQLLELNKVDNVFVMVSRWYGGIQLGPDRFKHINNAARNALVQAGLVDTIHRNATTHKHMPKQKKKH